MAAGPANALEHIKFLHQHWDWDWGGGVHEQLMAAQGQVNKLAGFFQLHEQSVDDRLLLICCDHNNDYHRYKMGSQTHFQGHMSIKHNNCNQNAM